MLEVGPPGVRDSYVIDVYSRYAPAGSAPHRDRSPRQGAHDGTLAGTRPGVHADAAVLACAAAEVDAGDPDTAVTALTELAHEHPLNEAVTVALMQTLYRSAESPRRFSGTPTPGDGSSASSASKSRTKCEACGGRFWTGSTRRAGAAGAAAQDVPGFVGRRTELNQLTAITADKAVVVISGMGGVGKTAPAVR